MSDEDKASRHSVIVRLTHWTVVLSVIGLLVTGSGILVSHPRLYWGETGSVGTESLVDLPIPFIIGPSVWNRPFHFLFAWMLVLTGLVYVAGGVLTPHVRDDLLPARAGRLLLAAVDIVMLAFLGLLAYFSILIVERMQMQRMTVIELPMNTTRRSSDSHTG